MKSTGQLHLKCSLILIIKSCKWKVGLFVQLLILNIFFYKLLEAESLFYTHSQSASGVSIIFYTVNSFSYILRFS